MPLDTPKKRRDHATAVMHKREGTTPKSPGSSIAKERPGLGSGLAEMAASIIRRRSADVDRVVEKSVTGRAKQASDENKNGTR